VPALGANRSATSYTRSPRKEAPKGGGTLADCCFLQHMGANTPLSLDYSDAVPVPLLSPVLWMPDVWESLTQQMLCLAA
jgi:hypothetical protein